MKTIMKYIAILALVAFCIPTGNAQTATTTTTLSAAIPAGTFTSNQPQWCVASATGIVLPSNQVAGTYLLVLDAGGGGEAAQVVQQGSSSTCYVVKRGQLGTYGTMGHASGATVVVGNAATTSGDPSRPFGGPLVTRPPTGVCTRSAQYLLPLYLPAAPYAGALNSAQQIDCFAGQWTNVTVTAFESINGGTEPAAATPVNAQAASTIVGGVGSAQSATTGNGGNGGAITHTGGIGGAGGSSSGTGGTGGAITLVSGAGGGTVTGGTGGAFVAGGGAGGAGTTAGGTGGGVNIYSGAAGSGGTGTVGAINIRSGGSAGTAAFTVSTGGLTTVASTVSGQNINLTPAGTGIVVISGATMTGPVYNAAGTQQTAMHVVFDTCTLGTSCSVSLAGNAAFTSQTSYMCASTDKTGANAIRFNPSAGNAFALTGTGTDVLSYICVGN